MKKAIVITLFLGSVWLRGQDSIPHSNYENVVRLNVTPLLISGPTSIVVGYERVLNESQSMSLNFGRVEFPVRIDWETANAKILKSNRNTGWTSTFDYRFYLRSRNVKPAPDGIYIGPFATFYNFSLGHDIEFSTSNGDFASSINTGINAFAVGVELGYQFTFGDRWTLDLVLVGPAYGYYGINAEVTGDLPNGVSESEAWEVARELLIDSFPGLVSLVENGEFDSQGTASTFGANFRYVIQVGYRF